MITNKSNNYDGIRCSCRDLSALCSPNRAVATDYRFVAFSFGRNFMKDRFLLSYHDNRAVKCVGAIFEYLLYFELLKAYLNKSQEINNRPNNICGATLCEVPSISIRFLMM
jgi:hypothetical protein